MPRLSIEISDQEHQWLKTTAALTGQSIKDYVLSRALPADDDALDEDQRVLNEFLAKRLADLEKGNVGSADFGAIRDEAARELSGKNG